MKRGLVLLLLFGAVGEARAHPGRTDSKGGHYNRKTGVYHYHSGGAASSNASRVSRAPRTSYRTRARTTVRKTGRRVARRASAEQETTPDNGPSTLRAPKPLKPIQAPRFLLYTNAGSGPKPIVSYEDQGDGYRVVLPAGGSITYPKRMVLMVEPLGLEAVDGLPSTAQVRSGLATDTIELGNGEKVRLLGVDTTFDGVASELRRRGLIVEATAFIRRQLAGEVVRLTYDRANAITNHRDKYRRLLAYVARQRDAFDANAELIRHGFAHAETDDPFVRMDEFRAHERDARQNKRGLWGPAPPPTRAPPLTTEKGPSNDNELQETTVYVTRTGSKYHKPGCRYLRKSSIAVKLGDAVQRYSACSVCRPVSAKKTRERSASPYAPASSSGRVQVRGYYRKDGTYVRPHTRRRPRH